MCTHTSTLLTPVVAHRLHRVLAELAQLRVLLQQRAQRLAGQVAKLVTLIAW